MLLRRAVIHFGLLAGLLVAPALAWASVHVPHPVSPGTPVHRGAAANDVCQLGTVGNADLVSDLFPPDDAYYTLLTPDSCGVCTLTALTAVHISLEFRTPCTVPVAIGLIPVTGGACALPDPQHPLVPSIDANLEATDVGITEFVVPVPATWKIRGNTFLLVDFVSAPDSCASADNQPRLTFRGACTHCTVYEYAGGLEDVCASGAGAPLMSAEVGECILTATRQRSWGSVKAYYR